MLLLYCVCALTLILNFLAEEDIGNAKDNKGDDDDEDDDNNDDHEEDNEDDNNNKMGQIPAAGHDCTRPLGRPQGDMRGST